ncbi:GspH/FimT family pseudopilin [Yersinia enterocolitica]|nr:GspH/FimT family pseudopilin [Yersinia enterocolitica]HEN3447306.1 GspH/FimT family pseudopilin [Yersinia enterocolitica]
MVLFLLAITSRLVVGSLPGSSEAERSGQQLSTTLQWAAKQAVLEGKIVGVAISHHGWQTMILSKTPHDNRESYYWPGHYWQPIAPGKQPSRHQLPANLSLLLAIEEQEQPLVPELDDLEVIEPKVYFLPSGESNDFELQLVSELGEKQRIVNQHGEIVRITDESRQS